jgi:monooxygenase
MSDYPSGGPVTFVNRFTLSGAPEAFEAAFAQTADFLRAQPGLIEFTLLRSTESDTSYVNIAHWDSKESLHKAVRNPYFAKHAEALRAVATSEPHIYAPRQQFTSVR